MKFPTTHGIGEIRGDLVLARECYQATLTSGKNLSLMIDELEPVPKLPDVPQEIKVILGDLSKVLKIGLALSASEKMKIRNFLREN